ncbi:MAG: single-stranded DNA-binding protein [Candidatus Margulisiibacteriota bacterium]
MYNRVFLIGNLTRDPEVRYTTSGLPVAKFAIAVNRPKSKKSSADEKGEVDFINIVAWRRLAEICKEYLKKGRPVAIEGRLQIREYEKDGQKRSFSEVVADNMQMLGKRGDFDGPETFGKAVAEEFREDGKTNSEEVPF